MPDLKPCPKCGSSDVFAVRTATLPSDFRIKCNHCGFRSEWSYSWEGAVIGWNRRANDEGND